MSEVSPWVILGIVLVAALYALATYNAMVSLRNQIAEAWSNIDTELKRRYELIPNLVEVVRGYAAHEQAVFENVARARTACVENHGHPIDQQSTENALSSALGRVLAVAESLPDLKADAGFLNLHRELVNTEDRIQAARRFYNGNVREYRVKRESFPSSLIASGFPDEGFLEFAPAIHSAPPVRLDG